MPLKIQNNYGTIAVDSEIVARIAGLAAMECYGIVGMATRSLKDGIVHLLQMENLTRGVELSMEGDVLNIDVHVIAEYGTNITAICETLMSSVKYRVEDTLGLNVASVNVFVEGLKVHV
ncbi:MAG: Asp23/Gls24 family envelope stress response protein [Defluviitaleaceae bacterium]|nr:Asp23/Gls24 family envelope stress response protein [Defluviitaleaceae bacterium]